MHSGKEKVTGPAVHEMISAKAKARFRDDYLERCGRDFDPAGEVDLEVETLLIVGEPFTIVVRDANRPDDPPFSVMHAVLDIDDEGVAVREIFAPHSFSCDPRPKGSDE